jgi:hypothetical protein
VRASHSLTFIAAPSSLDARTAALSCGVGILDCPNTHEGGGTMKDNDEVEIRRIDETRVEERSIGSDLGLIAFGAAAGGFLNPLGSDLYDKAKDVASDLIHPGADEHSPSSSEGEPE